MIAGDLPSISASAYSTNTIPVGALSMRNARAAGLGGAFTLFREGVDQQDAATVRTPPRYQPKAELEDVIVANAPSRRVVQVFIADPNENVPLEQALIYQGEVKLTDLTDQELFFEIDIKTLLAAHNEKRVKIVDKNIKDRTGFLDAVKIRDLKMVVVTVAGF